jgi:XRE family transcriptional regulator, regulator of sulfur utilization
MRENLSRLRLRLGRNIRQLRAMHDWSIEELAERVDIGAKHVGEIERGNVTASIDSLLAIANELGVDVADLLRGAPGAAGIRVVLLTRQDRDTIEAALRIIARSKQTRGRR